jgi:predicted TIM-barrel fold metal-dependent hydrolase
MIIDTHTHLWPVNKTPSALQQYFEKRKIGKKIAKIMSADGLLAYMEKSNVEYSIVSSIALKSGLRNADLKPFNMYVKQETDKSRGKLRGFFTVDPFGGQESIDLIKRCIEDMDFQGLKLHPCIQQFYPNDNRFYGIYEVMQKYGLPILFHSGGIGVVPFRDSYGQPRYLDDVACDFPDLPILMGHGGRIWYDETAMLLRKHKNMFADISTNFGRFEEQRSGPMEWLLYKIKVWAGTLERVLFGSDYPFYFQDETLEVLNGAGESLNKGYHHFLTDDDITGITYINPKKFCERFTQ